MAAVILCDSCGQRLGGQYIEVVPRPGALSMHFCDWRCIRNAAVTMAGV